MAPTETAASRVYASWKEQGVWREESPALETLDAFERARGVTLPPSLRELWLLSDGTAAMDDDEFIFWPFDNIADDPSLSKPAHPQDRLVFADWKLTAQVFCLKFVGGLPGVTVISASVA